uniref:Uncharacterized protein n=1 Tax=Anguilla anguilla TaxID=7936 RepID=A0A0E9TDF2_ANGAN
MIGAVCVLRILIVLRHSPDIIIVNILYYKKKSVTI